MNNTPDLGPVARKRLRKAQAEPVIEAEFTTEEKSPETSMSQTAPSQQTGDHLKLDYGKPMWHLLPLNVLRGVAQVLTFGAQKYSEGGWMDKELTIERCYSAMMRHYDAMMSGEFFDKESKLPHACHFCTNAIFICYKALTGSLPYTRVLTPEEMEKIKNAKMAEDQEADTNS